MSPPPNAQLVSAVVKAIQNAPLSLAPTNEGSEVLVKLPRMTKDTIEQVHHLHGWTWLLLLGC